jgi:hypothetical protein
MRSVLVVFVFAVFAAETPSRLPADEPPKGLEGKWEITSQQYDGGPGFAPVFVGWPRPRVEQSAGRNCREVKS